MQAKSPVHELIENSFVRAIVRVLPDELWLSVESTLRLSDTTVLDPDIMVSPATLKRQKLTGPDVDLAVRCPIQLSPLTAG